MYLLPWFLALLLPPKLRSPPLCRLVSLLLLPALLLVIEFAVPLSFVLEGFVSCYLLHLRMTLYFSVKQIEPQSVRSLVWHIANGEVSSQC